MKTVEELATDTGVSVRTIRFYTTEGLLPGPVIEGRRGLYTREHAARLDLVRTLQEHGYTLSAIKDYLERLPDDATVEDMAMFRALLAPWTSQTARTVDRAGLVELAGRDLEDDELRRLAELGAVTRDGECYEVTEAGLDFGLQLLDLPMPFELLVDAREVIEEHTDALAADLTELLRRTLVRPYLAGEGGPDLADVIERLKPLTIQAVVVAFQQAVDRTIRESLST